MRFILYCLLFIEGFVLLGFEMLASRYLNPYFGSGIDTWACIISVVLISMMFGYMIGGNLSKKFTSMSVLSAVTAASGIYMIIVSLLAHTFLQHAIEEYEYGFPLLFTSAILIQSLPVFLMSFWSPYLVRSLTRNISESGGIAGLVYGISTLGNVVGTLVTAFILIPRFGTSQISLTFGIALILVSIFVLLINIKSKPILGGISVVLVTAALLGVMLPANQAHATNTQFPAQYPEGVFFSAKGDLYFTEMSANRIIRIANGKASIFWQGEKCGPTGFTRIQAANFAVACHLEPKILVLDQAGKIKNSITHSQNGFRLTSPNDINMDDNGGAFFSDAGIFSASAPSTGKVFHIDADLNVELVASKIHYANGVAFDASSHHLFVSEHLNKRVLKYKLNTALKAIAPPEILFDFSEEAIFVNSPTIHGPDGLRVLSDGSLLVGLYGTSHVAHITNCKTANYIGGFDQYVTSVGHDGQSIAVASAENNHTFPYFGNVHVVKQQFKSAC